MQVPVQSWQCRVYSEPYPKLSQIGATVSGLLFDIHPVFCVQYVNGETEKWAHTDARLSE